MEKIRVSVSQERALAILFNEGREAALAAKIAVAYDEGQTLGSDEMTRLCNTRGEVREVLQMLGRDLLTEVLEALRGNPTLRQELALYEQARANLDKRAASSAPVS